MCALCYVGKKIESLCPGGDKLEIFILNCVLDKNITYRKRRIITTTTTYTCIVFISALSTINSPKDVVVVVGKYLKLLFLRAINLL